MTERQHFWHDGLAGSEQAGRHGVFALGASTAVEAAVGVATESRTIAETTAMNLNVSNIMYLCSEYRWWSGGGITRIIQRVAVKREEYGKLN